MTSTPVEIGKLFPAVVTVGNQVPHLDVDQLRKEGWGGPWSAAFWQKLTGRK